MSSSDLNVSTAILTYYGIDGACAAAMSLIAHPEAGLYVASQRSVGDTLAGIADSCTGPGQLHVCGLGVACAWERVAEPLTQLRDNGVEVFWHCGRGYLDNLHDKFSPLCKPVFNNVGSNARALAQYFGVAENSCAGLIEEVARQDARLDSGDREPEEGVAFWRDLIQAAISQWFKYNDSAAYRQTVEKLSWLDYDVEDQRRVEVYRRSGFQYVLHGKSSAMRELRQRIARVAEADLAVLILGESGVGKEHVAHLVHERSRRNTERLVAVNCATFAGNAGLANSMLFGHVKGAFTGALHDRAGAFAAADGGVLFLDELGEMPLDVQAKFLRVLDSQEVTPEGSDQPPQKLDVRVIAATNRNLPEMIRAGTFRGDLYHRLSTLRLPVPPLREHPADIPEIVSVTLRRLARQRPARKLSPTEYEELKAFDWPGNVRQLIKVIQRAIHMEMEVSESLAEERELGSLDAVDGDGGGELWPRSAAQIMPINEVSCRYAARALELCQGNKSEAARVLGISPNTLRKYLGTATTDFEPPRR